MAYAVRGRCSFFSVQYVNSLFDVEVERVDMLEVDMLEVMVSW